MGVDVLEALDVDAVRRWSRASVAALIEHQAEIDALNVYPVPDCDTGTNMALTMSSADEALGADDSRTASAALRALARGAVLGARGNSGVIMSQLMRGVADAAGDCTVLDGPTLAAGLRLGATQARLAVAAPVDGTILTVAQAAADAATTAASSAATLPDLARVVVTAADEALTKTTSQLDVLAQAGVVDAGGRGLVLILDALAQTVAGDGRAPTTRARTISERATREMGSGEFAFEVQYLVDAEATEVDALRSALSDLGDSVVVVGTGDGTWNVHVHVNDVGAAIESGLSVGRPYRISVAHFSDHASSSPRSEGVAVVAVAPGDGVAHLFEVEGVVVVDGRPPSSEDVYAAVRATGASEVVLLPNASTVEGAAERAADLARNDGVRVAVIPTHSPVQGLAAVAVHDRTRRFDDDVVAMAEAAAATRYAEIAIAQAESLTSIGICQKGDVLGLIDGEVVEIGRGLVSVAFALVDRLLGVGAELMTVLVGVDAPPSVGELIMQHVRERGPLTEVSVYIGGQVNFPIIIGVE